MMFACSGDYDGGWFGLFEGVVFMVTVCQSGINDRRSNARNYYSASNSSCFCVAVRVLHLSREHLFELAVDDVDVEPYDPKVTQQPATDASRTAEVGA